MSITVQHVPAQHPYTRAIRPLDPGAAPDVEFLPDPPVPGAPAHQWWPPRALRAEWLAEHRPDVLHVHFGFEHFSPAQLAAALDAQHAHGGAVVVTVHDLENPHLTDQGPHRDRLAVLLGRADAVLTLTPGAAATLARDYGVRALVVPHPHIVPLEDLVAQGDDDAPGAEPGLLPPDASDDGDGAAAPARLLVHAKDLRAQVAPVALLPVLAAAVGTLAERGVDARVTVEVQDTVQDEDALAALRAGCAHHGFELWQHDRLDDPALHALLRDVDVSVLPYRIGTHSGWVEMCRDLGVPVAVADIGHIADQSGAWLTPDSLAAFDPEDPDSLADALETLVRARARTAPADPAARARQRRRVAAAHVAVYREALARARGALPSVSVLVITGHRDEHLARAIAGLERSHRRPDQVVVVFMGQPDGRVPATDLPVTVGHVAADAGLPLAQARNRAAELATGEILVFLDVDCIPAAETVGVLATEVAAHPGSVVMGRPRYLRPGWVRDVGEADLTSHRADALLRRLSVPHRARAHLTAGPSDEWHLVWTLILALRRADLARIGGFDAGFTGYGAEDTDLAFRARAAGLTLRFSPAEAFHQHHGVMTPPLHHLEDILVNARRFRQVHGRWAMEGWLRAFADAGLIAWDPEGERLELLRHPTEAELTAARRDDAAY
ncbi:glycosyltransferase [Micrococcus luteus]|uniref:glycosyltransferase n=3 Tax=Micrococcus TaxID=1269 RepID=UPI00301A349B